MHSYGDFAYQYDMLMHDVDYKRWFEFIHQQLNKVFKAPCSVCELGCGTGSMTLLMAEAGYDMIGIDLSEDMLMIAREKCAPLSHDILFLNQDMRSFELYGTVDAFVSTCDSMNYIRPEDMNQIFALLSNYMNPGGLFIFDLNTEYRFSEVYKNKSFTDVGEDYAVIWENSYDEDEKANEYYISLFIGDEADQYERIDEHHIEYVHDLNKIIELGRNNGFEMLGVYDDYSEKEITDKTERMTVVMKKKGSL